MFTLVGVRLSSWKVSGSTLDQLQRDLDRVLYAVLKKGWFLYILNSASTYKVSLVLLIFMDLFVQVNNLGKEVLRCRFGLQKVYAFFHFA